MVMGKALGRPRRSDTSPVKQAALLVWDRVTHYGLSQKAAAKEAAAIFGVNFETVRKCARALLVGPQVQIKKVQTVMGVQFSSKEKRPLLVKSDAAESQD